MVTGSRAANLLNVGWAMALRTAKKIGFVASLLLVCVIIEGLSFIVIALSPRLLGEEIRRTREVFDEQSGKIRQLMESNPRHLLLFDPRLGWRYRPGYRDPRNQINLQGLRSTRVYAPVPASGVLRIAAFGDSFVYCNEVANAESWPALMEAMFPYLEILNYGVGGYGTDQAYLRFMIEGGVLAPDVVIMGFASVNLGRAVNVYRRFISNRDLPLVKPRFIPGPDGDLLLLGSPLKEAADYGKYLENPRKVIELGRYDYWYEPAVYENPLYDLSATVRVLTTLWVRARRRYLEREGLLEGGGFLRAVEFNSHSTAFRIETMLLERFRSEVAASGALPIVVIFPDRDSVAGARRGRRKVFDPLLDHLEKRAMAYVDLSDAFVAEAKEAGESRWFMPGDHYSGDGNRTIAAWLARELEQRVRVECQRRPRSTLRACGAFHAFR